MLTGLRNPPRVLRNLAAVYAATALNGALGLVSVPIGVRFLGVEGYGLFSLYTLMVGYVLMADFGVSKNLLAVLSRNRQKEEQLENLGTAFSLYCGLSLLWLLLIPLLLWLVPNVFFPVQAVHKGALQWLTVLAVGEFVVGVPQSMMQTACVAREDFRGYSRFTVGSGMLRNSILIAGAVVFRSPLGLAAAMFSRKLIELVLAYRLMGPIPGSVWRAFLPNRRALAMLSQSGTLSIAQILYSSLMTAGSYLINARFGLYWLGLYRVAFDLAGKISVLGNGIALVMFPKLTFALSHSKGRELVSRFARPALEASWMFYALLGACAAAVAPQLLQRMGIAQPGMVMLFTLLAVGLTLNCHALFTNEIIQALGRYRSNILVSVSGLGILVTAFLLLAPGMGAVAIGVSWILAAAATAGLADSIVLRSLGVDARERLVSGMKKTLSLAVCVGLLAALRTGASPWLLTGALGVLAGLLLHPALVLRLRMRSGDWHASGAPPSEAVEAAA